MSTLLEEKLREAACIGDLEAIHSLLLQKVDVNSQNQVNGWTALHWAAKRGNDRCVRLLLANGADKHIKNHQGTTAKEVCPYSRISDLLTSEEDPQQTDQVQEVTEDKYVPHYIKNAPLNAKDEFQDVRPKSSELLGMQSTLYSSVQSEELVLKVRIHASPDPDFIEVEIPRWKLTYSALLKICCEELNVNESLVERIRKLPNTRLRKDNDVKRLSDFQELELVLKGTQMSTNCYESISTKDQRILY